MTNRAEQMLARLKPGVRAYMETELRKSGDLAADAPLEDAFLRASVDDDAYWDCVDACYVAYDEAYEACNGDEICEGKVGIGLKGCLKGCG